MGKSVSKLSILKQGSPDHTPKPKNITKTLPPPKETKDEVCDGDGLVCVEVLGERRKINLKIKSIGGIIHSADLTKKTCFMLKDLYTFETKSGSGIGVPSKWILSLHGNPFGVSDSTLQLCFFMSRKPLDSSASTDVVVPIHAAMNGTIRLVCDDLMNSQNETDLPMQKAFENIPTEMMPRTQGSFFEDYNTGTLANTMGWMTCDWETINAIRVVSPSRSIDLVLDGHIFFSRTDQSPVSLVIKNPSKEVTKSKNKWLKMGKSLLESVKD